MRFSGLAVAEQQCGAEGAAVADRDLLGAVEADGDRLPRVDLLCPIASRQGVFKAAVAEIGCGGRGPPGLTSDGVGADEAPGPVVDWGFGAIGEGDLSGEAVPPEITADAHVERRIDRSFLRIIRGFRRRLG